MNHSQQKARLDEILLTIGGLEESLRMAQEQQEWKLKKILESKKTEYYERLRRCAYGLPEDRPAEES